jgi:valyl-tRNA synthetase
MSGMVRIPDKPSLEGIESKWYTLWQEQATYQFDRSKSREQIYSIDTPPPTISGFLHLGTAFGYIQVDAVARYHRMAGREVFYPMGWDDNGLPTERRVQNHFGVSCDPSLPYQPDLEIAPLKGKVSSYRSVSRPNFVELCMRLTKEFEADFEQQWRHLGLSVDWTLAYATINERSRRVAQRGFLRNLARGEAYANEAPTMWDVDFQTAVAQAECEDRPTDGAYHRLAFRRATDDSIVDIETTRPELLVSCVALVAHPDSRYSDLFGTEVLTPVFGLRVPVLPHRLADPDKGTGIAMVCTFGDATDVVWWRELGLPTRSVVQRDGRFRADMPTWLTRSEAQSAWSRLSGRTVRQARSQMVELLKEHGALLGEPRKIVHDVKFYEKGERPLEIVASRQWYIRNGARDAVLRKELIDDGRYMRWHPDFMRIRYEHWVEGLNTDWLISRQRYFGVPFPVWYRLDHTGTPVWDKPITAAESSLPVDPQADAPPGYTVSQRGEPDGFIGDPDVMDTWATSSLTPQIAGGWEDDEDLFQRVFPFDLRPQGPEIIRTWLFSTLLRSALEHKVVPWKHATINGWILDPDRKKMSKSKDNVLTPMPLAKVYGSDGLRYWACKSGPGVDTSAEPTQMKSGRRLAVKILNVGKFVLGLGVVTDLDVGAVTEPMDRAMLSQLASVLDKATVAFADYEYQHSLELVESFFWRFCDDYIELVKGRAYGQGSGMLSARTSLSLALSALLRLFAPVLPFVTEEVWSWWRTGSVHRAPWPRSTEFGSLEDADPSVLDIAGSVLMTVRKAKSEQRMSQRNAVAQLNIADTADKLATLKEAQDDLRRAGHVEELILEERPEPLVTVKLAVADRAE